MKRATLLLAAALIAALSLTSCAHLGISTPQPNQEVPWKDETAAAFGEITGGSVTSAVTDGGIGVVTRDSRVHGQAAVLYLDMKEDAGVSVSCRITGASRAVKLSYRAPDGSVTTLAGTKKETEAEGVSLSLQAGLGALVLEGNASCTLRLTVAGLDPETVRYVNSHSPGTPGAESLFDREPGEKLPTLDELAEALESLP